MCVDHVEDLDESGAGEDLVQKAGDIGLDGLRDEAAETVWIGEICEAVDEAAGNVGWVDAGEGIDLAGVAANGAADWVGGAVLGGGDGDVGEGPRIIISALVPVVLRKAC